MTEKTVRSRVERMGKGPSRGNSVSKWLKERESKAHGRNCKIFSRYGH